MCACRADRVCVQALSFAGWSASLLYSKWWPSGPALHQGKISEALVRAGCGGCAHTHIPTGAGQSRKGRVPGPASPLGPLPVYIPMLRVQPHMRCSQLAQGVQPTAAFVTGRGCGRSAAAIRCWRCCGSCLEPLMLSSTAMGRHHSTNRTGVHAPALASPQGCIQHQSETPGALGGLLWLCVSCCCALQLLAA